MPAFGGGVEMRRKNSSLSPRSTLGTNMEKMTRKFATDTDNSTTHVLELEHSMSANHAEVCIKHSVLNKRKEENHGNSVFKHSETSYRGMNTQNRATMHRSIRLAKVSCRHERQPAPAPTGPSGDVPTCACSWPGPRRSCLSFENPTLEPRKSDATQGQRVAGPVRKGGVVTAGAGHAWPTEYASLTLCVHNVFSYHKVIAQAVGQLGQGVGGQRRHEQQVGPIPKLVQFHAPHGLFHPPDRPTGTKKQTSNRKVTKSLSMSLGYIRALNRSKTRSRGTEKTPKELKHTRAWSHVDGGARSSLKSLTLLSRKRWF